MRVIVMGTGRGGEQLRFEPPGSRDDTYAEAYVGTKTYLRRVVREGVGLGARDYPLGEDLEAQPKSGLYAYLTWIHVPEARRGRGRGAKLLEDVLGYLDELGVRSTYGVSAPDEDQDPDRLFRFYQEHGFEGLFGDETVEMVRRRG